MSDIPNIIDSNNLENSQNIIDHLNNIKAEVSNNPDLVNSISKAIDEFNKFFLRYGKSSFSANKLLKNDIPSSELYNENLRTLASDLNYILNSLKSNASLTVTTYNFASIVSKEISNLAEIASSKVIDLSIINNFIKGSFIVAGDDFKDNSKIDLNIESSIDKASLLDGGNGIILSKTGIVSVGKDDVKITITPVMPAGTDGKVNISPTFDNLERFYEGSYYNFIGQQRPEGGKLNIKYLINPSDIKAVTSVTTKNGEIISENKTTDQGNLSFYAVVPASEEDKQEIRKRMMDGNPTTFWECEYVYETEPLIDPFDKEEN